MRKKIKLIIEVDEKYYEACKDAVEESYPSQIEEVIANGIPLSKGHGRLIDETKITKCEQVGLIIKDGNIIRCLSTDAPTIVKADKKTISVSDNLPKEVKNLKIRLIP